MSSQQVLLPDHSVYSAQWIDLPEVRDLPIRCVSFLLERYLAHIRKSTFSLVRPANAKHGLEFRLLGIPLLSFESPRYEVVHEGERVSLPICGGILVRNDEDDGSFSLAAWKQGGGIRVQAELAGYHPFLLGKGSPSAARRLLYRYTQGFVHRMVTVSYLADMAGQLTGSKVKAQVREVPHKDGLPT